MSSADHRYVPLLMTTPGVGWVLGYTIAAEIGDITRFASPTKLAGYTGLCPRVYQSGGKDHRGPLAKNGPKYLRWALIEAAVHAARHPVGFQKLAWRVTCRNRQIRVRTGLARLPDGESARRDRRGRARPGRSRTPGRPPTTGTGLT
jgi:transposase